MVKFTKNVQKSLISTRRNKKANTIKLNTRVTLRRREATLAAEKRRIRNIKTKRNKNLQLIKTIKLKSPMSKISTMLKFLKKFINYYNKPTTQNKELYDIFILNLSAGIFDELKEDSVDIGEIDYLDPILYLEAFYEYLDEIYYQLKNTSYNQSDYEAQIDRVYSEFRDAKNLLKRGKEKRENTTMEVENGNNTMNGNNTENKNNNGNNNGKNNNGNNNNGNNKNSGEFVNLFKKNNTSSNTVGDELLGLFKRFEI
jgi:hypothetical protein